MDRAALAVTLSRGGNFARRKWGRDGTDISLFALSNLLTVLLFRQVQPQAKGKDPIGIFYRI